MENLDGTNKNVMDSLIFSTILESLSFLVLLAFLFVFIRASYALFKNKTIPWGRIVLPCILGSILIQVITMTSDYYLELPFNIYVENILSVVDSVLMLLVAIAFSKLVKKVDSGV